MYGQLASSAAWAGLYMDVNADLNAKYAIMHRKTLKVASKMILPLAWQSLPTYWVLIIMKNNLSAH